MLDKAPSFANFLLAGHPEPVELDEARVTGQGRFFNRELSWLAFNWRVLGEGENPRVGQPAGPFGQKVKTASDSPLPPLGRG